MPQLRSQLMEWKEVSGSQGVESYEDELDMDGMTAAELQASAREALRVTF